MKLLPLCLTRLRFATCTPNLRRGASFVLLTFLLTYTGLMTRADDLGLFEGHGDVGQCRKAGSVVFEPATGSYLVAGGGANMWFTNDACQFVWKRLSGNFSLQADAAFAGTGGNAHRKACLVIRQSLAPDAPYVDVSQHGSGLTSLQWRETAGGPTREIQANVEAPARIGLDRQGDVCFVTLAPTAGQPLQHSGAYTRVKLVDPVYIGLAVCQALPPVSQCCIARWKSSPSAAPTAGPCIIRWTTSRRRIGQRMAAASSSTRAGISIACRWLAGNRN